MVPCSVNLTGKRDKVGHGEVTINNAWIIGYRTFDMQMSVNETSIK